MQPTWMSDCGRIVLYRADCLDVLPTLAGVDCVVTDPPYQSLDVEVANGTTTRLVRRDEFGGKRLAASDGPQLRDKGLGDIIRCPTVQDKVHPTQKPVEVITQLIQNSTDWGAMVLDPFMGAASTGIACIRTGRRFIGIEVDEHYFAIAQKRIEAELASTPLFDNAVPLEQPTLFSS